MDTRWTKFKYSYFSKFICIFLSALMFFSFSLFASRAFICILVYGFENYMDDMSCPYTECEGFYRRFVSDLNEICKLAKTDCEKIEAAFTEKKDEIVGNAVNSFLDKKAEIIRNELQYAVENYDDSYFNYEYTADIVELPETTRFIHDSYEEDASVASENNETADIPRNIEAAKIVLKTCKGQQFLDYEALIRQDALTEQEFHLDSNVYDNGHISCGVAFHANDYTMNKSQAYLSFTEAYEHYKGVTIENNKNILSVSESLLSDVDLLKYVTITEDGDTITNIPEGTDINDYTSEIAYAFYDGNEIKSKGFSSEINEYIEGCFENTNAKEIKIILLDDNETADDYYSMLMTVYKNHKTPSAEFTITAGVLSLFASITFLFTFLLICSHRSDKEGCHTAYIDKMPTDIHTVISFGAAALLIAGGILLADSVSFYSKPFLRYFPLIASAILTVCFLLLTEWIASVVRIKKCGGKFFAQMLTVRALKLLLKIPAKLVRLVLYKPLAMRKTVFVWITGYIVINILLSGLTGVISVYAREPLSVIFFGLIFIAFNGVCLYFISEYFRVLDLIIDSAQKHKNIFLDPKKTPKSLIALAENLTDTNKALQDAVEQAVREEQMKTELITNVSHDLKTPLTSLISYSELLEKCDIDDESAQKYIGVINTQSIKLKRLIEDLIEASKVSSGNVTITKTRLNMCELANQLIAEYSPETEKNGNEIVFNEPEESPYVLADSSKTYRILSNLLSNAKKYSAPDTRIYVSVYSDRTNGYFEIKNVSCEPLNISPDELTERFVRGDKSRTKDGNGLGLSIAKDLCQLQNGELKILIDGDLFKVVVALPSAEK